MAAIVIREDVKGLFNKAMKKFSSSSGLVYSMNRGLFLKKLSDEIFSKTGVRISQNYLQKKLVSELLSDFHSRFFHCDRHYLNGLYGYVVDDPDAEYENEFRIEKSETDFYSEGIKKVSGIMSSIDNLRGIDLPKFPIENANYPSTPSLPFYYKDFKQIWIKDESYNITGTVKDRWAWGIIEYYKDALIKFKKSSGSEKEIPRLCMMSSGSGAIALQYLLRKYGLPSLKVLLDRKSGLHRGNEENTPIPQALKTLGAKIDFHDLRGKQLKVEEVKKYLRAGADDIEISLLNENEELNKRRFGFYDWLSFEILNQNPDYCIIPFGSGLLFQNVLEITKRIVTGNGTERRFFGDINKLKDCTFLGATPAKGEMSIMDKLIAYYPPQFNINDYRGKFCNSNTAIIEVPDEEVKQALVVLGSNKHIRSEHKLVGEASGLVGLALFFKMESDFQKDARIVIVNTGKLKTDKYL